MNKDPYLKLEVCGLDWNEAPFELHLYNDMLFKKTEWERLGFKIKLESKDSFQFKSFKKGKYYCYFHPYFDYHIEDDIKLKEAVEQKKKYIQYPEDVYRNRKIGITYEQIITIDEDIKYYAESHLAFDDKKYKEALKLIKKSLAVKPKDINYIWLYYDIKLALKDITVIDEIIIFFQDDIDCFIYPGNMFKWIRLLVQMKQFEKANEIILKINSLLDDLIKGIRQHKIYTTQKPEFYVYEKEKFNEKLSKTIIRINKHLQKG